MRAIIHVDGDAFFASCEVAQNERLRGRPVVTGEEKGMAIAVSYEAKARGVSRGMLIGDVRKLCKDAVVLPGNYALYKICARRMYEIVRRHAPRVEEYSIDECFAEVSSDSWDKIVSVAKRIKYDLEHDLGMTFSLGLAPTKTLAKVASKLKKPAGFTAMQNDDIKLFLKDIPIGAVWGVGKSTYAHLHNLSIETALEFAEKNFSWVQENLSKPHQELWYELNGASVHRVGEGSQEKHQSIRATRTFRPPTQNKHRLLTELSKNAERACAKLRHYNLQAKKASFFLKTQTFLYTGRELAFVNSITAPSDIMNAIEKTFDSVFDPGRTYRATGVVLYSTLPAGERQPDLFCFAKPSEDRSLIFKHIDAMKNKACIFLASSLGKKQNLGMKQKLNDMRSICLKLGFPYWGEAS